MLWQVWHMFPALIWAGGLCAMTWWNAIWFDQCVKEGNGWWQCSTLQQRQNALCRGQHILRANKQTLYVMLTVWCVSWVVSLWCALAGLDGVVVCHVTCGIMTLFVGRQMTLVCLERSRMVAIAISLDANWCPDSSTMYALYHRENGSTSQEVVFHAGPLRRPDAERELHCYPTASQRWSLRPYWQHDDSQHDNMLWYIDFMSTKSICVWCLSLVFVTWWVTAPLVALWLLWRMRPPMHRFAPNPPRRIASSRG